MKKVFIYSLLISLFFVSISFALDLDTAKNSGLVGEKTDGYLGSVTNSAEVNALVNDINQKRKIKYQEIAKTNGTDLKSVEMLAGKKAYENTKKGHYVLTDGNSWIKK
jgi:uncharacterized protein YdbL (DUF1318 family)